MRSVDCGVCALCVQATTSALVVLSLLPVVFSWRGHGEHLCTRASYRGSALQTFCMTNASRRIVTVNCGVMPGLKYLAFSSVTVHLLIIYSLWQGGARVSMIVRVFCERVYANNEENMKRRLQQQT